MSGHRLFAWLAAATFAALVAQPADQARADGHETLLTSHGISAFGELKYPADFPHFDYVNPDAPKGGFISFRGTLASQTFDSLNLFILKGEPAQGLERIYDTLLTRAFDEPDAVYGLLAETIEYPEDRSWVIFNLRPEARFSDGEPVTAEDVAFTIDTLKTLGSPQYQIILDDVEGAEILDTHRVKVTFTEGASTRDLIAQVGILQILPEHYYRTVAFDESTLDPPIGSGPYVIDDVDPARSITYCRNPDYWGADLPVRVGTGNFGCATYEYFADRTAAFEALKSGTYLFHEENTSAQWATGYDFPALENGWVVQETLTDGRSSGAQGFWMNLRRPNLQDPRVREAIGMLFNFEWTNQTLFYGLYERTDSFWENSTLQSSGMAEGAELAILEEFRDQLPPEVFTEPAFVPRINGPQNSDRRALRAASALLDEAGWLVGDDGTRRTAEGETLRIEYVGASSSLERIVLPFIENMTRAGIDAIYTRVDFAQMEQRQEDFDYDIIIARLVLPLSPSVELRTLFGSQSVDARGTLNLAGVNDPVVDALIERIIAAETREELETNVHALDRVLRAMHIWVPNWYKGTHWLAYWDVFGRPDTKPPYDRGDDTWWFVQEKYDALQAAGALR
ncbi:MAG: ABC transporter substrate-binding protein [Rhodobacteraceae bacterium]|nr:ABC transporter substrate-binding protein [Paracoccaceae bacterium]